MLLSGQSSLIVLQKFTIVNNCDQS